MAITIVSDDKKIPIKVMIVTGMIMIASIHHDIIIVIIIIIMLVTSEQDLCTVS